VEPEPELDDPFFFLITKTPASSEKARTELD